MLDPGELGEKCTSCHALTLLHHSNSRLGPSPGSRCLSIEAAHADPLHITQVLGPLTAIMLLSGLIRHYVSVLINSPPKKQPLKAVREQSVCAVVLAR